MLSEEEIQKAIESGEQFLTPWDIAHILSLQRDTVRRKMQKGDFEKAFKIDDQWYMTRRHLTEYIARGGKRSDNGN